MKRQDLLRLLRNAGFTFKEGGRHTRVMKNGIVVTMVPRHRELDERLCKTILKITGINKG